MNKQSENGFGIIEGFLIIAVLTVLGFAGWYAWKLNSKAGHPAATVQPSAAIIPSDWTTYKNPKLGISFAYPKTWTFEDTSQKPTSTLSYHVGELTADDKSTSISIMLVRKVDRSLPYTSLDGWKAYAQKSHIAYTNLTPVSSSYSSFSYILDVGGGSTGLEYEVLNSENNLSLIVLPTDTAQKATIEKLLTTLRFE